ncbi:MAG: hypothetical protein MPJ05_06475 [Nitrosopumilus sp.]|nr:hypothetical protein [Nitrosopumilus sp.]
MVLDPCYARVPAGSVLGENPLSDAAGRRMAGSVGQLISIMRRLGRGEFGRSLDARMPRFDLPSIARERDRPSSPSGVVLLSDVPVIRLAQLGRYEGALAMARDYSGDLRRMDAVMGRYNRWILETLGRTWILHRGMTIRDLEVTAEMGGAFGLYRRRRYAAATDFASFTIDARMATEFARKRRQMGLVATVDVSGLDGSEYEVANYEARNDVLVVSRGRSAYCPYERFGGSQSGLFLREAEIRLRAGSRPRIISLEAFESSSPGFEGRLVRAAALLERAQGSRIRVKYGVPRP